MEFLLNLAWLLMALPAWWLWRNSRSIRTPHRFSSLQCLLALGCVLVMLFPVISATDDVLAMRTEMEESPLSKRSIRQANDKSAVSNSRSQAPAVFVGARASFALAIEHGDLPLVPSLSFPATPPVHTASRAPPVVRLA